MTIEDLDGLYGEDWIKALSWDLPRTLDGLLSALGVDAGTPQQQAAALAHFVQLPAAQAMPLDMRRTIEQQFQLQVPDHTASGYLQSPTAPAPTSPRTRIVDASDDVLAQLPSLCKSCMMLQGEWFCYAYPDGIPEDICIGGRDHRESLPGDHGIQYDPDDALKLEYEAWRYRIGERSSLPRGWIAAHQDA